MNMMVSMLMALAQEEYYAGRLGWEWQYEGTGPGGSKNPVKKIVDVEVVRSVECFIVEDTGFTGPLSRVHLDVQAKGVKFLRMAPAIDTSFLFLKFPLKKGETWVEEIKIPNQEPLKLSFEVQDPEELTVPAGKFKSIRVAWSSQQGASKLDITSWFAPEQGEIARKVQASKDGKPGEAYEFKLKKLEQKKISVSWRRPAGPCKCPPGKCDCLHCGGTDKEAKCYCNMGGCTCGAKMPGCNCRHCEGLTGADDGKGNCGCKK